MAVATIQELIARREAIAAKKKQLYELETSVGTIICRAPSAAILSEADSMSDRASDSNAYLVYNCVVEPDLRNSELQKAYNTFDPLDIVGAIFQTGEIARIAGKLVELAGYKGKIASKIHEQVKN